MSFDLKIVARPVEKSYIIKSCIAKQNRNCTENNNYDFDHNFDFDHKYYSSSYPSINPENPNNSAASATKILPLLAYSYQ